MLNNKYVLESVADNTALRDLNFGRKCSTFDSRTPGSRSEPYPTPRMRARKFQNVFPIYERVILREEIDPSNMHHSGDLISTFLPLRC